MAHESFKIEQIGLLDGGRVAAQINKLIKAATDDCLNRYGVDASRKVAVGIMLRPVLDETGLCSEVAVEFTSTISAPKMHSKTFSMGVNAQHGLVWNTASEDNVNQGSLDEL